MTIHTLHISVVSASMSHSTTSGVLDDLESMCHQLYTDDGQEDLHHAVQEQPHQSGGSYLEDSLGNLNVYLHLLSFYLFIFVI